MLEDHLVLRGASKTYAGGVWALERVDLAMPHGELLCVVGPSGSGKSTLLRVIAGLERADSGAVLLNGEAIDDWPPARRDMALVFQSPALFPHLSVLENLAFGLRARGVRKRAAHARARETASLLRLDSLLERRPAELSGGEGQRVALGRALARRPGVLLLDEPFASLDAPLRVALRRELRALQRVLGTTTVLVTHDQSEALALGDRVAVFDRGRAAQCASSRVVHDRPASLAVARFIGDPPMDILDWPAGEAPSWLAAVAPGGGRGRVALGVRPEHLTLSGPRSVGAATLTGTVSHVEPRGHEALATVRERSERGPSFTIRTAPVGLPEPGEVVTVTVDVARASWFDLDTGERLDG